MSFTNDPLMDGSLEQELREAKDEIERLQSSLAALEEFHPRAMKLLRKRKNFLVVADDEPYFFRVYVSIREHEKEIGRWMDEDENNYQRARQSYIERPIDLPEEK